MPKSERGGRKQAKRAKAIQGWAVSENEKSPYFVISARKSLVSHKRFGCALAIKKDFPEYQPKLFRGE
jgi:hypothetical protein